MAMTIKQARAMRAAMEAAAVSLDDKTASTAPELFPRLKQDGALVTAGTRVNWGGVIKRAAVDLWDREDQDPEHAAAFWEDLDYVDGIRKIPDVITVGTAFALGEQGWRGGVVYKSLMDNNVWTPEEYASAWEVS